MYDRIIKLIGITNFQKIQKAKILLVGCGGVGSFAYTALIRSGFQNITVIDKDKVEITNLNRQLVANLNTINKYKVDIAAYLAQELNEDIHIKAINEFLTKDNMHILEKDYDYIIDACDTLNTKLGLIRFAEVNKIKIISSMGMGNRIDASRIKITTLDQTHHDPLAKILRKKVGENNLNSKIPVVFSEELPSKKREVDSLITSPGIAGLLMVNYIINDLISQSEIEAN